MLGDFTKTERALEFDDKIGSRYVISRGRKTRSFGVRDQHNIRKGNRKLE